MSGSVGLISTSKENQLNLTKLVNLALSSSPKVGIVNFNVLKTFLLELINALNLQNYEPKFGDETKNLVEDAIKNESQHDEILNLINENINPAVNQEESAAGDNNGNSSARNSANKQNISILTADMKPITLERFHKLEGQLHRLENQISTLNALPTNQQLIDKTKDMKRSGASGQNSTGPIMEVWQYTQLSKRMESNEEGLTKLTSLLQDVIGDMNELKESQTKNSSEIKSMNDLYKDLNDRLKSIEKLRSSLVGFILRLQLVVNFLEAHI
jgi:hypothetical protein